MDDAIEVLLVEDCPGHAELVKSTLAFSRPAIFIITWVSCLKDAFTEIQSHKYNVILLDLSLPDTDGVNTVKRTCEIAQDIPIIVLTSLDDENIAIDMLKEGAQDYLVKGKSDLHTLSRTIRHAMERKRLWVRLENAEKREHFLATRDVLTGLPNRQSCYEHLNRKINYCKRYGGQLAIMFMDLDRFKFINDTLGHHVGDGLLKEVAIRIQSCLRETDLATRFGGDEFVFVLNKINYSHQAAKVANNLLEVLKTPVNVEGHELFITASIGIALYPNDGEDLGTLIQSADTAMYSAKEFGPGGLAFFTPEMNEAATHRLTIENDIRHALANDELYLLYQPLIAR